MSNKTDIADAAKCLLLVPFHKLKKSPKNVRKVPHTKADVKAIAASIAAVPVPGRGGGDRPAWVANRPALLC